MRRRFPSNCFDCLDFSKILQYLVKSKKVDIVKSEFEGRAERHSCPSYFSSEESGCKRITVCFGEVCYSISLPQGLQRCPAGHTHPPCSLVAMDAWATQPKSQYFCPIPPPAPALGNIYCYLQFCKEEAWAVTDLWLCSAAGEPEQMGQMQNRPWANPTQPNPVLRG